MTKARDIADGQSVDTTNFVTKSGGVIEALDGSALTNLTSGNLNGALPNIDGSSLTGIAAGGGKILQVVSAETTTTTSTTNGNLQDTSLALNITPSSSSSKIFIQVMPQLLAASSGSGDAGLGFGISREIDGANNTTVFETAYSSDGLFASSGGSGSDSIRCYPNVFHLDTPNTTGECRYKFRIKAYSGDTAQLSQSGGVSKMIAFEIEG